MSYARIRSTLIAAIVAAVATISLGATAVAQPGPGYGPGMMGGHGPGSGYGPGMMGGYGGQGGGYGPGYGMGPGMMGGYGQGWGMGPGMMGGWGRGGGGVGPGMMGGGMGFGMLYQLNLTPEQWDKVNAFQEEASKKQWEFAGRMREEGLRMRNLMFAEKRDRGAILAQFRKLQDIRQQRFQLRLDIQEKIDGILTKEQKAQRRRFGPGWLQGAE